VTFDKDAQRRSEAALKRMLATPPTRHKESKLNRKPKVKKAVRAKPKSRAT